MQHLQIGNQTATLENRQCLTTHSKNQELFNLHTSCLELTLILSLSQYENTSYSKPVYNKRVVWIMMLTTLV